MTVYSVILLLMSSGLIVLWSIGFVAVQNKNIKDHQSMMVLGYYLLVVVMTTVLLGDVFASSGYEGYYTGAYWLISWIVRGLGVSSLLTGGLALWSMSEGVIDLHRRAGMFAFLSGVFCSFSILIMNCLIWFS